MLAEELTGGRVIPLITGGGLPLWATERVKLNSGTQRGSQGSLVVGDSGGSIWMRECEVIWEPCRQLAQCGLGQRWGAGFGESSRSRGKGGKSAGLRTEPWGLFLSWTPEEGEEPRERRGWGQRLRPGCWSEVPGILALRLQSVLSSPGSRGTAGPSLWRRLCRLCCGAWPLSPAWPCVTGPGESSGP